MSSQPDHTDIKSKDFSSDNTTHTYCGIRGVSNVFSLPIKRLVNNPGEPVSQGITKLSPTDWIQEEGQITCGVGCCETPQTGE